MVAISDLDEAMATMDPDESFLVLDGHELQGSIQAESVVSGSAGSGNYRKSTAAAAGGGT